jgi:hypothetical protein
MSPTAEQRVAAVTLPEWTAKHFAEHVDRIVNEIARLGAEVSRKAFRRREDEPFSDVAASIQHEVLWSLANMGIDHLTTLAARADNALTTGPVTQHAKETQQS